MSHDAPPAPAGPEPLTVVAPAPRRTAAEEARTLVAATTVGALATLTTDGAPWASLVSFAPLPDGSPVLCVSTLAEHGRNLEADPRASLMVAEHPGAADPLATGRVTLLGMAERPQGAAAERARAAYVSTIDPAATYVGFGDFSLWVLRVERVRWVGGYGRMASARAEDYAAAQADPVAPAALHAVAHLNDDHADAMLTIARALGGHPDATRARCTAADRYGLDLALDTPRGRTATRVAFSETVADRDGLRAASVELVRRARAATA